MDFSGPILAVGDVKRGGTPQTGADRRCLIVEVKTPTSMGEFVPLEITESAASDLVRRLADFVLGGRENWNSVEADLED
jgi:hypothetical protein